MGNHTGESAVGLSTGPAWLASYVWGGGGEVGSWVGGAVDE